MRREVAAAIFYNKENKILLQNRKKISKLGEEWGFFGGGIEKNETPKQALVREIKEELNYEIKEFSFFRTEVFENENHHIEINYYLIPLDNINIRQFDQKEGNGMVFYSLEEAKTLKMNPKDKEVIQALEEFFKTKDKI